MTVIRQARLRDVAIGLMLSAAAVLLLVSAYSYSRASGIFPIFVGWIFLSLALVELVLQVRALQRQKKTMAADDPMLPATRRDILGGVWLCALVGLLFAVGFLIATPVYVFSFLWLDAKRGFYQSLIFAALATAFIYVIFVFLLKYKLYPGLLFAGLA
jgi:hypothetical protein